MSCTSVDGDLLDFLCIEPIIHICICVCFISLSASVRSSSDKKDMNATEGKQNAIHTLNNDEIPNTQNDRSVGCLNTCIKMMALVVNKLTILSVVRTCIKTMKTCIPVNCLC